MKAVGTMFLLKLLSCAAAMLLPLYLPAEIVLQEPASGATVQLLPENQKMLLALPSHAGRVARLAADRAKGSDFGYHAGTLKWRTSLPVRFRWKCTAGEKGPFILRISRDAGFREVKEIVSRTESIEVPPFLLNLRLGRKYYWNVSSDRGKKKSASGSFTTDPQPPRWIMLEGPCRNIRDLGGYVAADGRKVRQGMLFRGERLNENSFDPAHPGRNRLMVADAEYLRDELKIRTDLDLRSPGETAGLKVSPLGSQVKFVNIHGPSYQRIFGDYGRRTMAKIFKILCDPANYPVYFHCSGGADRTGALALVLNGVLGVSENDLCADWGNTFFPRLPDNMSQKYRDKFNFPATVAGFEKYGKPGDPLRKQIESYLLANGVTAAEIASFRKIMLEEISE